MAVKAYCGPPFSYATVPVEVTDMSDNVGSKVTYFLVGLGVGALVGVLFAPKSGEETRDFLAKRADDGREFAQKKARELRERADELIERGKDVATRKRDSLTAAVEAGREAFLRESKS
jgi:gas vesicle protein